MNTHELQSLYDDQQRMHADIAGAIREDTGEVVRFYYPNPERHAWIQYSRLTNATVDAIIAEQIQYFRGRASLLGWTICAHDQAPASLGERLVAHRFAADDPAAVMVLELAALPNVLQHSSGYDIRRMAPGSDLRDVQTVLNAANGRDLSGIIQGLTKELQETPERISVYVAYVNEQPASCGWIRFPPGMFASLWAGATVAEFRGHGFYTALVAIRAREAQERGYPLLIIDAGAMSQPIVERVGFTHLTTLTDYKYTY